MSRRLVAAAVALVLLASIGGSVLGGVFAVDSTGSGLQIAAADGPNGDYADLSNDRIELDLSEGGGVSNDAVTELDAVFVVTNDRSYAAPVWVDDNSSALGFYDTETGEPVDTREHARNLSAGESLRVGVTVDMRHSSIQEVESTDGFAVETLVQDTTGTGTEGNGSSSTDSTATETDGTATETDSADPGGGTNPSGGQQGGGTESAFTVHNTSTGATISVRDGQSADPFTAALTGGGNYVTGAGTDVTAMSFALTFDREDWRVELTHPTAEPQDTPSVDAGEAVSYFRVTAIGAEASAFDRVGVNASVALPDGADPGDVSFYRHAGDGWQRVETTHHGGDRFGADIDGFGEVAVVVDGGTGSDGTGDEPSTDTETDDDSTSTDATATPGSANESTETATAGDRAREPLELHGGLGETTVVVFGLFSVWLAGRGRVGGGPGGL